MDCREDRISPLRGGLTHNDIINQTRVVKNGLTSLRDDHYTILANIRHENDVNKKQIVDNAGTATTASEDTVLLEERINNVTRSLEQLEVGIEESAVLLGLSEHFERLEADRSTLVLEMGRVRDENDWLREELCDVQGMLREAQLELEQLRLEKDKWDFEEEVKTAVSDVRPITPSKIPVGAWRVEEEKDINRALNGGTPRSTSPVAPAAPSRIPVGGWRTKLPAYNSVMQKESQRAAEVVGGVNKRQQYFNLHSGNNANAGKSKIPSR